MKKKKRLVYICCVFILFGISFIVGYKKMNDKRHSTGINDLENSPLSKEETTSNDEKIVGPDTIIEGRVHYKTCDDTIVDTKKADNNIINMDKDEFELYFNKKHPESRIISFSHEKIVTWTEKEHLCKNHYIIGEEDGFIAVYNINDEGEKVLKNIFEDYSINLLLEVDKNKIKTGIIVNSEEELSDVLENFIS